MMDNQELDVSDIDQQQRLENPETILGKLRTKAKPIFDSRDPLKPPSKEIATAVRSKFRDILIDYPDGTDKSLVSDLLTQVVATGCEAFGIDPVELIIIPKELEKNHIGAADRKKVAGMDIKQLFIDPKEIMFRVQVLSQTGIDSAKNITDIMFVFMHEMAHLGQSIHAEGEYITSKQFPYAERPTEVHADEVALLYCKKLSAAVDSKSEEGRADNILSRGLPETIKEAEVHRRPLMQ